MQRLSRIYPFTKGMGLAAPQIGVSRTLAVVRPPDSDAVVALLNPVVTWQSPEEDEQYEGCLSLFDVRGKTRRPLAVRVRVEEPDGLAVLSAWPDVTASPAGHSSPSLRTVPPQAVSPYPPFLICPTSTSRLT